MNVFAKSGEGSRIWFKR